MAGRIWRMHCRKPSSCNRKESGSTLCHFLPLTSRRHVLTASMPQVHCIPTSVFYYTPGSSVPWRNLSRFTSTLIKRSYYTDLITWELVSKMLPSIQCLSHQHSVPIPPPC